MKHFTFLVIPENSSSTSQYSIPVIAIKFLLFISFVCVSGLSFMIYDYRNLSDIEANYKKALSENEGLKGEARLLVNNLNEVRRSLQQVQIYTSKLSEITQFQINTVSTKTGIGPLSTAEYNIAMKSIPKSASSSYIPVGINIDKLIFKPVFKELDTLDKEAHGSSFELQKLLSNLSQQKSLLSSIPSISPVNGWMASGFGHRISPFTGEQTWHMGVDIAAPQGAPIYAPADGVVLYCGERSGFGKFIVIAHGYGIVTRYGHNALNMVQAGQRIKRSEQIGSVGMTGRTTGPHLHYEVLLNGRNTDPKKFMLNILE